MKSILVTGAAGFIGVFRAAPLDLEAWTLKPAAQRPWNLELFD